MAPAGCPLSWGGEVGLRLKLPRKWKNREIRDKLSFVAVALDDKGKIGCFRSEIDWTVELSARACFK